MAELYIPEPNEKQKLFLAAKNKHIAYGGARGGGKSWSVRTKAKLLAVRHAGIKILIMRRTYPELQANHIDILKAELVPTWATYNTTEKKLTFFNGSTIKFMYCKNDADLNNIQGHEYDVIFIDEATNMTEKQLRAISVCCRGVNNFPKHVYYTMNPGGPGHGFIKRLFIDRRFQDREIPEEYSFIQALVDDNTALMEAQPDYLAQLEALPGKLREAWRFGRWDVFEGQVFGEFADMPENYRSRQWTHVIEPMDEIPASWTIYRGFDWGYSKPFSCAWYAISNEGRMYMFRELYGCTGEADVGVEWTVHQVAAKIREIETTDDRLIGKHIIGVADPAIFAENGGESIAETMEQYQVYFEKGDNKRIPGKMQCHYRLAFDENGIPMFYVTKNCKNFIRTLPSLIYSETDVEDIDTKLEDHAYDQWRYVCMARPIAPREKRTVQHIDINNVEDPLNMVAESMEAQIAKGYSYISLL